MYLEFYQLREYPFSLASDPRFLYFSPGHKEAMAALLYSLRERKGVALLLGEPGTGKTTVLSAVMEMLPGGVRTQALESPLQATAAELLGAIVEGFGLPAGAGGLNHLTSVLRVYLMERHAAGECVVLVVDEAQDLNPMALEQLRLLTNLEAGGHKLLQVILSGQPELAAHLRTQNGRALHQRVAVRCQLRPLGGDEAQAYIAARLKHAGAVRPIFEVAAVDRLQQYAHGVPRILNVAADHCLLAGFAAGAGHITAAMVDRVALALDMEAPARVGAAAGPGGMQAEVATPSPTPARAVPAARLESMHRPPALQRFVRGWARWAGLMENGIGENAGLTK